jgi:hypothetical protein
MPTVVGSPWIAFRIFSLKPKATPRQRRPGSLSFQA